jgi:hypothetical protein
VQARNNAVILDVGEPADVKNELRSSTLRSEFKAGSFYIAIGQTEFFADLTETEAGDHVFLREGKSGGRVQHNYRFVNESEQVF